MTGSQTHLAIPNNTNNPPDDADRRGDGLGRSFSFLQTPAEYHAPKFPPSQQTQTQSDKLSHIEESPPLCGSSNNNDSSNNTNTTNECQGTSNVPPAANPPAPPRPPEPAPYAQNAAGPPPLSSHPANFAPYADPSPMSSNQPVCTPTPGQHTEPPKQVPTPTRTPEPPTNPQRVHNPHAETAVDEQQRREKEWAVVPDDNPLASPASTATFAPNRSYTGSQSTHQHTNHLPGQTLHPSQRIRGGVWSHSICDCGDVGVCCTGIWCPCILYGRTQYRLSMKSARKDPTNLLGYEICNAPCTGMALLCGCQWLFATIQHVRTRRAYDIDGSLASDCVRATCCTCCTLIQDEREIKVREEAARTGGVPGGAAGPTGYIPPTSMAFSPPPR